MKSFLHSSFFILHFSFACACLHAHAAPSYWAAAHTGKYAADASAGSEASKAAYSGYYCTVETAAALFGGSTTAGDIVSYLSADYATFAAAKDFAATQSGVTAFDSVSFSDGEYALLDYAGAGFTSADYVALAFYASGDANGFQVFDAADATLTPYSQLVFKNDGAGAADGWIGAPTQQNVPEPTSGLLMLLGLAGLALRRRRLR